MLWHGILYGCVVAYSCQKKKKLICDMEGENGRLPFSTLLAVILRRILQKLPRPLLIYHIEQKIAFKGTVSLISSYLSCKDGNAQFSRMPLKPISVNILENIVFFPGLKEYSS